MPFFVCKALLLPPSAAKPWYSLGPMVKFSCEITAVVLMSGMRVQHCYTDSFTRPSAVRRAMR